MFQIRNKDVAGRIGEIRTRSGSIRTPALLPVVNPIKQEVEVDVIKSIGFESIITNAYILKKRREREALERGVHRLLGFQGPIMTDSGGYQILEYGKIDVTPRDIVEFQEKIGSDIAVILDLPTGADLSREEAEKRVVETIKSARESINYRSRSDMLWVYPVQGGVFLDLVSYSSSIFRELDYDIAAIGSPTPMMERYMFPALVDVIVTAKSVLPPSTPIHLFGAGHPMIFPLIVALGVDTFDSAAYILYARDDRMIFEDGTVRLQDIEELACTCPVCTKITAKELKSMTKYEREKHIAIHNLYISMREIKRIREAIRGGYLWELVERRARSHPRLYSALASLSKYRSFLAKHAPFLKTRIRGIFLFDEVSLARPEVALHEERLLENYTKPQHSKVLVLVGILEDKPLTSSEKYLKLRNMVTAVFGGNENLVHVAFYHPFWGIIPEEISECFPLSQFEMSVEACKRRGIVEHAERIILNYLLKNSYNYTIVIVSEDFSEICENVLKTLRKLMGERCIETDWNTLGKVLSFLKEKISRFSGHCRDSYM